MSLSGMRPLPQRTHRRCYYGASIGQHNEKVSESQTTMIMANYIRTNELDHTLGGWKFLHLTISWILDIFQFKVSFLSEYGYPILKVMHITNGKKWNLQNKYTWWIYGNLWENRKPFHGIYIYIYVILCVHTHVDNVIIRSLVFHQSLCLPSIRSTCSFQTACEITWSKAFDNKFYVHTVDECNITKKPKNWCGGLLSPLGYKTFT